MRRIRLFGLLLALLMPGLGTARGTGFLDRSVTVAGIAHRYVVYVPRGLTPRLPVVLSLHGSGERGSDGIAPTAGGLARAIRMHPDRFPAVVVFPQAGEGTTWSDNRALALATLTAAAREFRTDPARVYAVGLSMGGNGTWVVANDAPRRFAAIVVVCGFAGPFRDYPAVVPGPDPFGALAARLVGLPVWIVHGAADPVVPVAESRGMAAALTAAGGEVRYRELPGVGHNAWDDAFGDPALPAWLFSQRRR